MSFGTEHLQFGDINIVSGQLITFAAALAVAGGLHLFLQRTYTGRAFRAVAQHATRPR